MDLTDFLNLTKDMSVSDIHFIPREETVHVKFRDIKGLIDMGDMDKNEYPILLQKVKISAGLNISEKRLPQDGIIQHPDFGQLRISTLKGIHGEALTIRLFSSKTVSIHDLGFLKEQADLIFETLDSGFSMMVITGETGSGKSTTLKAIIKRLTEKNYKVVSIEDPVEISIPGTLEVSLNESIGLDYEKAIFASLRQDPDYIAIGEIRDKKTCEHCIKAALSGHPVITTLHSGDYDLTLMRLKSLTTMSEFVDGVLTCVINQKLLSGEDGRKLKAKIYKKNRNGIEVV